MKKYRDCLADAYVMREVLEYLSGRADDMARDAEDYKARSVEQGEDSDGYILEQSIICAARSAAFERLLTKLCK